MIEQLLNRPCVIRHVTDSDETDDYGNPIEQTVETATRCELQQRQRDENDQDLSATGWIAFFLAGTVIGQDDTVVVDGREYRVHGEPWGVHDALTGAAHHLEVGLERVTAAEDT